MLKKSYNPNKKNRKTEGEANKKKKEAKNNHRIECAYRPIAFHWAMDCLSVSAHCLRIRWDFAFYYKTRTQLILWHLKIHGRMYIIEIKWMMPTMLCGAIVDPIRLPLSVRFLGFSSVYIRTYQIYAHTVVYLWIRWKIIVYSIVYSSISEFDQP